MLIIGVVVTASGGPDRAGFLVVPERRKYSLTSGLLHCHLRLPH
jgi:hypothetical protein